jgi:hypothetical protein
MAGDVIKRSSLIGAVSVSTAVAIYSGLLFSTAHAPDEQLSTLHEFIITVLLATWLIADATQLRRAQPTFDYGWFIFAAFPVYVPYYLVSTRRWRGLVIFTGMLVLFLLPWLAQWVVWLAEVIVWYFRKLVIVVGAALLLVRWFVELVIQLVS